MYARCGAGEKLEITSKAYLSLSGGSLNPSAADMEVTQKIVKALEAISINVIDHIIVAGDKYTSFAEKGLMT